MAGFADGFRSGFGLISDVQDRELKRDQMEADSAYKKQQADDLAAYRAEDLRIKDEGQKATAALSQLRAETAATTAQASLLNAETASTKANNLTNPESIDYKKGLSEIAENEAQAQNFESQTAERDQKLSREAGAFALQDLAKFAEAGNLNGHGPSELAAIADLVKTTEASKFHGVGAGPVTHPTQST